MPRLKDFLELHFIIFLWGFTAILGVLIDLPSVEMVFIRTVITAMALAAILLVRRTSFRIGTGNIFKILGVGFLISGHWILFFASARVSSVSICLAGIATISLWTAFLEPIFTHKKIKAHEILLALLIIVGLYVIFRFEFDHALGITMAVLSALLGSIFTIINSGLTKKYPATTITCYEMAGAAVATALFFPVYTSVPALSAGTLDFSLSLMDGVYLLVLSLVCTVYAYTAAVRLMQRISAYTVNLTVNLEPVYGIILAAILFQENKDLSSGFYYGTGIILLSVFLHPILDYRAQKRERKLKHSLPN
jgi:drug/metabolite transporter (DMT)-like permease